VKKILVYTIFLILSSSCTLYTDNEYDLNTEGIKYEATESNAITKNHKSGLLKTNDLNKSVTKLETETKKIESEISTLLETF